MALEIANYISDLVETNPVGSTDFISQGDNHIRLIKTSLQQSFPNINAPLDITSNDLNVMFDNMSLTNTFDFNSNTIINITDDETNPSNVMSQAYNDIRYIQLDIPNEGIVLDNNVFIRVLDTVATEHPVLGTDISDINVLGNDNLDVEIIGTDIVLEGNVSVADTSYNDKLYPIGSIYTNALSELNPADSSLLGFGVWARHGEGRTGVCKSADAEFNVMGQTGGVKNVVLTQAMIPSHRHTSSTNTNPSSGYTVTQLTHELGNFQDSYATLNTHYEGQSKPHNNVMPYCVASRWKRIG